MKAHFLNCYCMSLMSGVTEESFDPELTYLIWCCKDHLRFLQNLPFLSSIGAHLQLPQALVNSLVLH